ncbi:MAG: protein kinase [bacterium]|nr:protein kinase [bacterium]
MDSPSAPAAIGRYRILRLLGSGAMGDVYVAEDPNIGRRVALKTVRLLGDEEMIAERKQRLLREAKAAGRLLHPNVVTLFDAGEVGGVLFLAFELVEGTDLSRRLRSSPPLTLHEVLRLVREVAGALAYAHQQGVVHRDIKPSNILLGPGGEAKVADFGIAKLGDQTTAFTQTGAVVGSPQYMSPEQVRGESLDGRSDLFSLGVVLYEMLSASRPFDGDTLSTLVFQILSQEPVAIETLRPGLPPRLVDLVHSLLAKDRDQRIASPDQLIEILAAIEQEAEAEELAAPAAKGRTRPLSSRSRPVATPASVTVPSFDGLRSDNGPRTAPSQRLRPTAASEKPSSSPALPPTVSSGSYATRRGRGWLALVALVAVAVLAGAGWWLRGRMRPASEPVSEAVSRPADTPPEQIEETSVAESQETAAATSETSHLSPSGGTPHLSPSGGTPTPTDLDDAAPGVGTEGAPVPAGPAVTDEDREEAGRPAPASARRPRTEQAGKTTTPSTSASSEPAASPTAATTTAETAPAAATAEAPPAGERAEDGESSPADESTGGGTASGHRGVTLYQGRQFRGSSETFSANDSNLQDNPIGNDTVSSVEVDPGCRAILFEHADFQGRSTVLTADAEVLRGREVGNDNVSSLAVSCGEPDQAGDREAGVVLYVHADFQGPNETFHDHDPDLGDNRIGADTVSSVRVAPGCEVLLYKRTDYRGAETAFKEDAPSLIGTEVGNDAASSIRVYCESRP